MRSGDTVTELRSVPGRRSRWVVERLHPHHGDTHVDGTRLVVAAHALQPGDYLPPQQCLDPTAWQDSGFRIGPSSQDVCSAPMLPSRMLLFGSLGVLDSLAKDTEVTVIRPPAT